MPSPQSNRRNACKSTGPRTPDGKAAVRELGHPAALAAGGDL